MNKRTNKQNTTNFFCSINFLHSHAHKPKVCYVEKEKKRQNKVESKRKTPKLAQEGRKKAFQNVVHGK